MSIMSPDRQGQSGTSSGAISVSNEQAPANVTPHTPDAGDQYYIGDCYNRALVSQEWELDTYVAS